MLDLKQHQLRLNRESTSWLYLASFGASLAAMIDSGLNPIQLFLGASLSMIPLVLTQEIWLRIQKNLHPSMALNMLVLVFSGAARGWVIAFIQNLPFGAQTLQVLNAAVTTLVWGALIVSLVFSHRKFSLSYSELSRAAVFASLLPSLDSQPELVKIQTALSQLANRIDQSAQDSREFAAEILSSLGENLAPLKKRLRLAEASFPRVSIPKLVADAVVYLRARPLVVALILFTLALPGLVAIVEPFRALVSAFLLAVGALGLVFLANKFEPLALRALFLILAVLGLTPAIDYLWVLFGEDSFLGDPAISIVGPIVVALVIWFSAAIELMQKDKQFVLTQLEGKNASALALDDFLHNYIEGRLRILLNQLLRPVVLESEELIEISVQLREIAEEEMGQIMTKRTSDPNSEIEALKRNWGSLLTLDIQTGLLDQFGTRQKALALTCVEEGIRNAFRHSAAKKLDITWRRLGGDVVEIRIESDVNQKRIRQSSGGGKATFDRSALDWSFVTNKNRSSLKLALLGIQA